jgi:methionine-rich copper-binding protein CopC
MKMTVSWQRRLAMLAFLVLAPLPAQAHAILVESAPAISGSAKAGPVAFKLRFNSRIDHARSRLTLTRPDKTQAVLPIASGGPEEVLSTTADLMPGAYSLRWQVLAIDGHITRGDIVFTVTP